LIDQNSGKMKTLTIQDESATGKIIHQLLLELEQEVITVAALIKLRVTHEVAQYNAERSQKFQGLVQPTALEQQVNEYQQNKVKTVDAEQQCFVALEAFKNNGFFVLIDNQQVTDLDTEILVNETTAVSFIKLTPLVGG